ncbi:hypothetical protein T484DRAFT_1835534, partial [Baffinella frigidus]
REEGLEQERVRARDEADDALVKADTLAAHVEMLQAQILDLEASNRSLILAQGAPEAC